MRGCLGTVSWLWRPVCGATSASPHRRHNVSERLSPACVSLPSPPRLPLRLGSLASPVIPRVPPSPLRIPLILPPVPSRRHGVPSPPLQGPGGRRRGRRGCPHRPHHRALDARAGRHADPRGHPPHHPVYLPPPRRRRQRPRPRWRRGGCGGGGGGGAPPAGPAGYPCRPRGGSRPRLPPQGLRRAPLHRRGDCCAGPPQRVCGVCRRTGRRRRGGRPHRRGPCVSATHRGGRGGWSADRDAVRLDARR